MFIDYRSQVLLQYKRGRDAKILSPLLIQPTPGNLKSECLTVCKERFDKNDREILRIFFGPYDNQMAYIHAIGDFNVDKFRPLWKFITDRITDTEVKNIELLAWLIDFQPRPFQPGYKYEDIPPETEAMQDENKAIVDRGEINLHVNKGEKAGDGLGEPRFISKHLRLIVVLLLFFIGIAGYRIWRIIDQQKGCMYWTGDHYEPVACNKKINNALVIATDTSKLRRFKKITLPDTITLKAIGYVWYSKINNKPEFFTADGYHPIQMQHHLKPLTKYMIEKHIYPGMKLE